MRSSDILFQVLAFLFIASMTISSFDYFEGIPIQMPKILIKWPKYPFFEALDKMFY